MRESLENSAFQSPSAPSPHFLEREKKKNWKRYFLRKPITFFTLETFRHFLTLHAMLSNQHENNLRCFAILIFYKKQ